MKGKSRSKGKIIIIMQTHAWQCLFIIATKASSTDHEHEGKKQRIEGQLTMQAHAWDLITSMDRKGS